MTVHVNLGLVLLSLLGTLTAPFVRCEVELDQCPPREGVLSIQQKCSEHGEGLTLAENNKDDQGVCRHLYNGLVCVAGQVPQCFNLYFKVMSHYFHSPHRCHLSHSQILQLQQMVAGSSESGEEGEEEDVRVSTSPTPAPPPSPQSSASSQPSDSVAMETKPSQQTVVAAPGGQDDDVEEIWTYLEADTNGTALIDDAGSYNVTTTPATSHNSGVNLPVSWTLCSACYLAYAVALMSWKLMS